MNSYELEDWVDYIRGLGDAERREDMARHLADGTDGAAEAVRMLEEVRDVVLEDSEGPAESLVWAAKTLADLQRAKPGLPHLPLVLVGSNVPTPAFEQQRQTYIGARKLLYRSDRFELDLWLEDPQGTSESVVLGRVCSIRPENAEPEPVADAGVFLIEEGKIASSTLTNRFGEFHLDAAPEGQIDLKIVIRDRGRIELSLPREEL
jgi:hypothetical protein